MHDYRLYYLAGERIVRAEEIRVDSEADAVRAALERASERAIEVWDRARYVARVPARHRAVPQGLLV